MFSSAGICLRRGPISGKTSGILGKVMGGGPMRLFRVTLLSIVMAAGTVWAQAQGVVFVEKETRNGQSGTNQIQLDKNHMRAESNDNGSSRAFVFDGTKQTAYMIDATKKTYT